MFVLLEVFGTVKETKLRHFAELALAGTKLRRIVSNSKEPLFHQNLAYDVAFC